MTKYTIAGIYHGILRRIKFALNPEPNHFLRKCKSIIHIGANDGGERYSYARFKLNVLWVEALPDVFQTLTSNLRRFPKQKAVNALVTDKEGETYEFHVSNNSAASSSIYDFKEHAQIWPEINFTKTISLKSTTLQSLLRNEDLSPSDFDALILDVQGAELLVIQGAGELLNSIRFILAEAADFEAYSGGCTESTLSEALKERGFTIQDKKRFASKEGVGNCYDILYERTAS